MAVARQAAHEACAARQTIAAQIKAAQDAVRGVCHLLEERGVEGGTRQSQYRHCMLVPCRATAKLIRWAPTMLASSVDRFLTNTHGNGTLL